MANVLSEDKKQQVIALGRLGWSLRRIERETGIRRETAGLYLRVAGVAVRPAGWGGKPPGKPAIEVTTDSGPEKAAISVLAGADLAKPAMQVTTDSEAVSSEQALETSKCAIRPQRSPSASACEPYRELIELSLGRGRNAVAIWQDLVSFHGFASGYQSVKRFVRRLHGTQTPAARVMIVTAPGEESQVDYGTGPMVRSAQRQVSPHPVVRDDAGLQPQGGTPAHLPLHQSHLGRTPRASLSPPGWGYPSGGSG